MATALVTLVSNASIVNKSPEPKRVVLKQVDGSRRTYTFQFGPKEVKYGEEGIEYTNIERPGEVPFLEAETIKARTISFTAVIADKNTNGKNSVESHLALLKLMAREDIDLTFTYGVRTLSYRVRLTDLSFDSIQRNLNGDITQAMANIQLTERPRRAIDPVTLNAIRYTPTSSPPAKTTTGTSSTTSKTTSTVPKPPSIDVPPIVSSPYPGAGGITVK